MTSDKKFNYPDSLRSYWDHELKDSVEIAEGEEIHFDLFCGYFKDLFSSELFRKLSGGDEAKTRLKLSFSTDREHFHEFSTAFSRDELASLVNSARKLCFIDEERGTFYKICSILAGKDGPISDLASAGKDHLEFFFRMQISEAQNTTHGVFGQVCHMLGDQVSGWKMKKFLTTYMYVKILHTPSPEREKNYRTLENSCRSFPNEKEELINFAFLSAIHELAFLVKNIGHVFVSFWKDYEPKRVTEKSDIGQLRSRGFSEPERSTNPST